MADFTHAGSDITLESNGSFTAFVNGQKIRSSSLAGIKKQIDGKKSFESFTAIREADYRDKGNGLIRVKIIGLKRGKDTWRNPDEWIGENNKTYRLDHVYVDTPENESALKEARATDRRGNKELDDVRERIKAESEAAWKLVKRPSMEGK